MYNRGFKVNLLETPLQNISDEDIFLAETV